MKMHLPTPKINPSFLLFIICGLGLAATPTIVRADFVPMSEPNDAPADTITTGRRLYTPPPDAGAPRGTTSTGRRGGCGGQTTTQLTALAPYQHVGQTTSTHPTFVWYSPTSEPIPTEFRLYRYQDNGDRRLVYETDLQNSSQFMSLSLPEDEPGLMVGNTYQWQVVMLCNPNRPSTAQVVEADIQVVNPPVSVSTTIDSISNPLERAVLFAESGLWYNALSEVLSVDETSEGRSLMMSLVEDLANLEKESEFQFSVEQGEKLSQILEVEQ
ncbi:MAG: DUF928 domain-containing protein [Elainellaceae cyanobacterium]